MATQVAPGYNPEVSLLQGGTAPITPMLGGGFTPFGGGSGSPPTPDYNVSASLLQGGTGVIEAVKGGGKAGVGFAPDLTKTVEFSKNAPPKNIVRASRSYTLEIYGIKTIRPTLTLDPNLSARQRRLLKYVQAGKDTRLLTSMSTLGTEEGQFAYTGYPKYGDCKPSLALNFFDVMAKKVQFMDEKAHILWIIPNLRGNKEVFETIYDKIIDNGLLPGKEHVLVFTGSFYPDTPNETSEFLFDEILKLKEKNPGQVFVVSTPDATLLRNGCHILENTYAMKTTLAKQQGKSKEVPTFFEPDVLVFPHENMILRSVQMPISADSKVSVGLLLRKKVAGKSFFIKGEPGRKAEPAPYENFTTILSDSRQPETRTWPKKSEQTIKCPAGMDCQNFEMGFPLAKLGTSIFLNLLETKLFLLHIAQEKIPYFTSYTEEGETAEEEEEEELEEPEEEEEEGIGLEPMIEPIAEIEVPKIVPQGHYKPAGDAKQSRKTVSFSVEGFSFTIRVPDGSGPNDPIRIDWLNEKFTQSEADFLNALQLSTFILRKAYGLGYKWRVSNFLGSLAISNCFKETDLLLKSECSDARRFLRKIGFELQRDCLNKAAAQWATPSEGSVKAASPIPSQKKVENELEGDSTFQPLENNELEGESTFVSLEPEGQGFVAVVSESLDAMAIEERRPFIQELRRLSIGSDGFSNGSSPGQQIYDGVQRLRIGSSAAETAIISPAAKIASEAVKIADATLKPPQQIKKGLSGLTIQTSTRQEVQYPSRALPANILTKKSADVAGTYILWKDALLIHRRFDVRNPRQNFISAPGGKVDSVDKVFKTTALRELNEEAQLYVNGKQLQHDNLKAFYTSYNQPNKNTFVFFAIELNDKDKVTVKGPKSSFKDEVQPLDTTIKNILGFDADPDTKYYRWVDPKELEKFLIANQGTSYYNSNFLGAVQTLIKWLGI